MNSIFVMLVIFLIIGLCARKFDIRIRLLLGALIVVMLVYINLT